MRYVLEREYDIELDFTDSVPIRVGTEEIDFCFMDLNTRREQVAESFSSNTIRSTIDGPMYELDERGFFSQAEWKQFYAVMTNIGMLRFDIQNPLDDKPRIMAIKTMKIETMRNQKVGFRTNLFRIDYENENKQKRSCIYSVENTDDYQEWVTKIREMIKDFQTLGEGIFNPKLVQEESK